MTARKGGLADTLGESNLSLLLKGPTRYPLNHPSPRKWWASESLPEVSGCPDITPSFVQVLTGLFGFPW